MYYEYLRYLYLLILTLLGVYSILTFKKNGKYIKFYAIVTLIVEIVGMWYISYYKTPIAWLYNLYSIFEMWIWASFFYSLINKRTNWQFYLSLSAYCLIFAILGDFRINHINDSGFLFNNSTVVFFVGYYFYFIIRNNLSLTGNFWIMAGALFYHGGGSLLTGMISGTVTTLISPKGIL